MMSHEVAHPLQDARDIEAELRRLWRSVSSQAKPVMRARVMTLVVVTEARDEAKIAAELSTMMARHPARTILLLMDEAHEGAFDASATLFCLPGDHPLYMEQIHLHSSPRSPQRLVSAVRLLLDPSLPSALWWLLPATAYSTDRDALAALTDRHIIDSRLGDDPSLFRAVPAPSVEDLAWEESERWREMVAALFDDPAQTPQLDRLTQVTLVQGGAAAEGWLMVGWLAAQLGWSLSMISPSEWAFLRPDGEWGKIRLKQAAAAEGLQQIRLESATQRFEVARKDEFVTCGRRSKTTDYQIVLPSHDRSRTTLLSRVLDRVHPDPLYQASRRALMAALMTNVDSSKLQRKE